MLPNIGNLLNRQDLGRLRHGNPKNASLIPLYGKWKGIIPLNHRAITSALVLLGPKIKTARRALPAISNERAPGSIQISICVQIADDSRTRNGAANGLRSCNQNAAFAMPSRLNRRKYDPHPKDASWLPPH